MRESRGIIAKSRGKNAEISGIISKISRISARDTPPCISGSSILDANKLYFVLGYNELMIQQQKN